MAITIRAKCQRCDADLGFSTELGCGANPAYYCADCQFIIWKAEQSAHECNASPSERR